MAQITIQIHGKPYLVGCEDGAEARLQSLAALFDAKVRAAGEDAAALGETRLLMLGALMLADETLTAFDRVAAAEAEADRLRAQIEMADARAVALLEAAAKKIELLAAR